MNNSDRMGPLAQPPVLCVDRLRHHAQRTPGRVAYTFLRDDGRAESIDYATLERRVLGLAALLAERVLPGERALLLYPAGLEFIVAYFACLAAGVIAVPATMPHKTRPSERLRGLLADCAPALVLTRADCESALRASLKLIGGGSEDYLTTDALEDGQGAVPPPTPVDWRRTAFLQYTSGSTAQPKGVEVTHFNIASNVEAIRKGFGFSEDSVMVSWLPQFHDMGLIGSVVTPLVVGFHCVLMAPASFLRNPAQWLEAVHHYRGTCAGAPNFGWDYCARRVAEAQKEGLDLSCLRVAYNGAEPVRAETLRRFVAAFERCGVREDMLFPCYGMAETTLFVAGGPRGAAPTVLTLSKSQMEGDQVHSCAPDAADAREIVGAGTLADGMTVRVVDPQTGLPVSNRRVGELWVSGPSVARGYWRRPEQTAATFGARLADSGEGPFLRTGDLGFMRDGQLFVTGRLKDLIIINGRNLYPQDVEEVVERTIDFIEPNMCAAFAVEVGGQERLALVAEASRELVRAAGNSRNPDGKLERRGAGDDCLQRTEALARQICQAIAQQLDVVVSSMVFVKPGTFPRTTSGKVQRARCKELALQGKLDLVYVMPGSVFDQRAETAPAPRLAAPDPASRARADALIAWVRKYAARRLNSRLIDERRTIPPYVVLDLGNQGFFGLQVPAHLGGRALATADLMRVLEQLAAIDLTVATVVGVHNGLGVRPILQFGTPAMHKRLLPALAGGRQLAAFALTEPEAGSNPSAMRARAVRTEGGWRLHAEKHYIGLASWAGQTTVFAKAVDAGGAQLGVIALVVAEDTPGLAQGPEALTMGMRGMVQNTVLLDSALVPDKAVLQGPGAGMEVARDAMLFSRLGIGAMCVGGMKRCAQLMARYAARREVATGRLADNPVTLARLQHLSCAIYATEALVQAIARHLDGGGVAPADAYLACKTSATELMGEAADTLVQMLGGRGYMETNVAPQILRDARVLRILEGPTETLYMNLGASAALPEQAAARFIGAALGRPAVAAELTETLAEIRADARRAQPPFAGDAANGQWLDYRSGELVAAAVLLAAAESRQAAGDEAATGAHAVTWARQRFVTLARAILAELDRGAAHPSSAALLATIERYADTIGDVEQAMGGQGDGLDPMLAKHQCPPVAAALPMNLAAPAAAAPAAPVSEATLRIVHDSVLQWLRGEFNQELEAIDYDTPFTTLGMDSLATVTIALALEEQVAMPIVPELLYDYQTVNSLAAYIDARRAEAPAGSPQAVAQA